MLKNIYDDSALHLTLSFGDMVLFFMKNERVDFDKHNPFHMVDSVWG